LSDLSDTANARITYAQNFEDVRLWKALAHLEARTYVDIGAGHPTSLSVTRLFYDRGWRGINVEPGPNFPALAHERSGDVNLNLAVDTHDGSAKFYVAEPYPDLSSLNPEAPSADPEHVARIQTVEVETSRLDTILSTHLGDRPIAFLKVDTEGTELDVLRSNDWNRYRPFVVVVEAITPGTHTPSYEAWEPVLLSADYVFAAFDGINRFYVEGGHTDLVEVLQAPVAPVPPIDTFTPYPQVEAERKLLDSQANVSHYVGGIVRMDAELKAERTLLRAARIEIDRLATVNGELQASNSGLEASNRHLSTRVDELLASWSWQIGNRVMAVPHRARHVLGEARDIARPLIGESVKTANRLRRIRSRSPERLRSAYRAATVAGSPLETVKTMNRNSPYLPGTPAPVSNQLDTLWMSLAARRRDRPRLVESEELGLLETFVTNYEGELGDSIRQILTLRRPSELVAPSAPPTTLVIDVRALQIPEWCGTKTHAANILQATLACVEDRCQTLFLTSPAYPPLDPELAALGDGMYQGNEIQSVGAFLQLAPFVKCMEPSDLDLLRAPWIKRATVWLDAIPGYYPYAYLSDAETFIWYQLGLEKLAHHEWILALSESAATDALDVFGRHEQVIVTGCRSSIGIAPQDERPSWLPSGPYVLVLGNALPHKNLAAAVAGFVPVADTRPSGFQLVIVANISPQQQEALRQLGDGLGLDPDQLVFLNQVTTGELAWIHAEAEAVVVPSIHEGFSLPVLESVQVGTPVVLSDIPAHRELLTTDKWFFPDDDPAGLANALRTVIADPTGNLMAQRSQLGQRLSGLTFDANVTSAVEALIADLAANAPLVESDTEEEPPDAPPRPFSLSKVCELEDFTNPRFEPMIRDVFSHELIRFGTDFPRGHEWRKYWEVAIAILTFKESGLLDGTRELLGIGAGNEPTLFYLTRFARRVLATDLYLGEGWEESADSSMLTTPEYHWPFPWNPDRLAVENMNALDLRLPDESVDGVFSSSSVEHFGDRTDVSKSIDEAYRVLRPGGVLSVSTEFRLRGERPGLPNLLMFDQGDIDDIFVGARDWSLIEPFDPHVSSRTIATATDLFAVVDEQQVKVDRLGGLWTHHIEYAQYPHIVLKTPEHEFTSFHIALRKAGQLPST
jgi:FkbM family methyltransferase